MSKNRVKRNRILAIVAKNDPTRFRQRTVESKKSKAKKRNNKNTRDYLLDESFYFI